MNHFTCQHVVGISVRRLLRTERLTYANGVYQALSLPLFKGPGDEATPSSNLVFGPQPACYSEKAEFGHYYSICTAHAPTVVGWELWFVPCGLLCAIVNMYNK